MSDYHDLFEQIDDAMTTAREIGLQTTDADEIRILTLARDRLFEAFQWASAAHEQKTDESLGDIRS